MKVIGIPGWMTGDNSFGVGASYIEFISQFGRPLIITPSDTENPPDVDLLIAPGGADLLPTSYGAVPGYRTQRANPILEHFDTNILPHYINNETPIFGICRGMQRLWAYFGGVIDQNNDWHVQSKFPTEQCHELYFVDEFKDLKKNIGKVTSRHHQCADASTFIPDELEVIAYSQANVSTMYYPYIVEMFRHKTLPICGVQFHPEDHDSTDKLSPMIIRDFLAGKDD